MVVNSHRLYADFLLEIHHEPLIGKIAIRVNFREGMTSCVCRRVSLDSSLSSMDTNSDTESRHKYGKMITDSHAFAW